jgi:aryl-alcohol dehydrogenase-like predicted oxidoreductase/enamine deaminase RidA (YjgF/YER057c/UK114 family)
LKAPRSARRLSFALPEIAMPARPDRTLLAPGLEISRIVTGLWQVADMERDGRALDRDAAAAIMVDYARDGFDSFDMADHYGSAELITGRFLELHPAGAARAFTKWCPTPGPMTPDVVRAGITERLERLGVDCIDLLQLHWWTFEHPGYIDVMKELVRLRQEGRIRHLGLTNFDTDHLRLLATHGFPIVSNQVSFSLLDRRAAEDMSAFCEASDIRLLAYGTLGGGFLTDRWVGAPEPESIADWSKSKYKRFIDSVGGWSVLQRLLAALAGIARKHEVSVANVATRWVLEQPAVAAVIVGARLGESEHRADNTALFSFALDAEDKVRIDDAIASTLRIPGDCGDEYRRPPFLTASGDLSHHLESFPPVYNAIPVDGRPDRLRIDSGSVWEPICGYSRAVRIGDRILVSGTTATHGSGEVICPGDPHGQAVYILDKIAASVASLGGSLADVARTRVYLSDADDWEAVSRVHGRYFGSVRPANTLLEVSRLVGDYSVEIEAEAIIS